MSVLNQLNMTPFEWTMTNKVAGSPVEFIIKLNCIGDVDAEQFNEAILEEVKNHPLLQANAQVGPTHRLSFWRPASDLVPKVRWIDEEYSSERGLPDDFAPIDLEGEIGFRFYGWRYRIEGAPRVVMKFVFHHACCDGKGGGAFVEQVLLRYQSLLRKERESTDSSVDKQLILNRDLPSANRLKAHERFWRAVVVRPQRVANMLLASPRELETRSGNDNEMFADPPRQCSTTLDLETTRALGHFAQSLDATTNLVLARELFHALNEKLNESKAPDRKVLLRARRLRILIPISLRDERHQRMPASNCVSMAYLEAKECYLNRDKSIDPDFLSELVNQFSFIRRWQLQYSWIESIESYAKLWPLLKYFKKWESEKGSRPNKKPIATAVMSNLGQLLKDSRFDTSDGTIKIGSLEIETVHLALPCNATLSTNFSLNFYRNRLTLDVTYLPSVVSRATAESLLESWTRRIINSAGAVTNE